MLQINTSTLKSRKKVEIDGHGYSVRRLGAGEQLTLSQQMRELKSLRSSESDEDAQKVEQISRDVLNLMANCFDDGVSGKKSKQLVHSLAPEELEEILDTIFTEAEDAETTTV